MLLGISLIEGKQSQVVFINTFATFNLDFKTLTYTQVREFI